MGQTGIVGLLADSWRLATALSHAQFGALYALATLTAAWLLIRIGPWLDGRPLAAPTVAVLSGLSVALIGLASTPTNAALLAILLVLLRLTGQGLLPHLAMLSLARTLPLRAGRMTGLVSLGQPIGDAVLGVFVVLMVAAGHGQQALWTLAVLPLALALYGWQRAPTATITSAAALAQNRQLAGVAVPRFWLVAGAMALSPAIGSGLFFHQAEVMQSHRLTPGTLALYYPLAAVGTAIGMVLYGRLADRLSPVAAVVWSLVPLAAAMVTLATVEGMAFGLAYFLLMGLAAGGNWTLSGLIYQRLYDPTRLSAIRSRAIALAIVGTATTPYLGGLLRDGGIASPSWGLALSLLVLAMLALLGYCGPPARRSD